MTERRRTCRQVVVTPELSELCWESIELILIPLMGTIGDRYLILFGRDIVWLLNGDRVGVNPKDERGPTPLRIRWGCFECQSDERAWDQWTTKPRSSFY